MPRRKSTPPKPALTGPKSEQLKTLLSEPPGATVAELSERLAWQPHTTRAALTRLKQSGIAVEKLDTLDGKRQSRYRIKGDTK